jgi:hypothetical protein
MGQAEPMAMFIFHHDPAMVVLVLFLLALGAAPALGVLASRQAARPLVEPAALRANHDAKGRGVLGALLRSSDRVATLKDH